MSVEGRGSGMTEEKAIGLLSWLKVEDSGIYNRQWYHGIKEDLEEALKMAMSALEQQLEDKELAAEVVENALKITDETMLEKAHEIARHNYLCGKREALEVIEDIKAEIEQRIEMFVSAEDFDNAVTVRSILDIIDKHCGKEHE